MRLETGIAWKPVIFQGLYLKPGPRFFVLEALRGRGQFLKEDTSLRRTGNTRQYQIFS